MAKRTAESELRRYAILGAEARLRQISQEAADIYRTFPELRRHDRELPSGTEATSPASSQRLNERDRRSMSATARKAVGERMKKYWAARRKQSIGAQTEGPSPSTTKRASRKMSAAARKRISEAQKKRWAKYRQRAAS